MQGGALSMVAYDISVLLRIQTMKATYRVVPQPWYTDNVGSLGMYNNIKLYFNSLKQSGTGCGYYM